MIGATSSEGFSSKIQRLIYNLRIEYSAVKFLPANCSYCNIYVYRKITTLELRVSAGLMRLTRFLQLLLRLELAAV